MGDLRSVLFSRELDTLQDSERRETAKKVLSEFVAQLEAEESLQ
jgi:hypothetical protein